MPDPKDLGALLAYKLARIVELAEDALQGDGPWDELEPLLRDPDVQGWLADCKAHGILPLRRFT